MWKLRKKFDTFIKKIKDWGLNENKIDSILLVGSYARDNAKPDSDIDLIIIVNRQSEFINDHKWIHSFGNVSTYSFEDWGRVQSIRVFYKNSFEVEFGIAESIWAEIPVDPGTLRVIHDGCKIIIDKSGLLQRLIVKVHSSSG